MIIYLSGGFQSGWQDRVIDFIPDFIYLDPRTHGLEHDPRLYTLWDLIAIDRSDILFAYLEADNPSGLGLALEIGYAKAKGKHVILVDEKNIGIIRACADAVLESFEDGLKLLRVLAGVAGGPGIIRFEMNNDT